ncbi:ubiquinone anaerobic biosynthesis protein UbiU [Thiohalophilus sp.]|uniref:ubiquinone anaerobic biosynthesis protein UbiU n=1 Tax=Thiohalophilus sp. TaxID=3028392 RepID=UPI002ACE2388|nr:peptidase U32 family protein [Thiohalophilus sp.]MDZ7660765.1 peptidase U32 family protein [Thiohalophilus sp.]
MNGKVELVAPAGSFPALRKAVDNGADAVYIGFRDATNARNFPGLNFDEGTAGEAIAYAHQRGSKVLLALNTYPQPGSWPTWTAAVDRAAALGVDALILADTGLLRYAHREHPGLRLHLSVQGSATSYDAIAFYREQFDIKRVVLPRVLSLTQVKRIIANTDVEIETFAFGSLCVMVEGRCYLSSYVTGESPNTCGACSPAHAVQWHETAAGREVRLNDVLIDVYKPQESAGYPVLCKGRFEVNQELGYALEEPTSLSVLDILPELVRSGVSAIKIEGRQRSPAYVAQVTHVLRQALDAAQRDPDNYTPRNEWILQLDKLAEGNTHTLGALDRQWQ